MEKINTHNFDTSQLEKKKYDIVFIGGGPATLSFISHLFQKNKADKIFSSTNILIIEKDENFGSGCLGKYGINTNTSSEGFPRLICYSDEESKEKNSKFALSPSKNVMKSSKNYNNEKLKNKKVKEEKVQEVDKDNFGHKRIPLFNEIFQSSAVQTLMRIGNRPAPLTLVGYFLDCLGNFIVHYVKNTFDKNILLNKTEVKSVKLYNTEDFGIVLKKVNSNSEILVKTKCVILATGGKQNLESSYFNEIVSLKGESKVFSSDFSLTEKGYGGVMTVLNENATRKRKVVIIGGSHSGFSCAWILLNNPSNYNKIIIGKDYEIKKEDGSLDCNHYGSVLDRNWQAEEQLKNFSVDDIEINILYRDNIKVFYPSEEEALKDNYTSYNSKEACNKYGKVYPFIGIRGDAKDLYLRVIRNEENRIKLIQTQTNKEQIPYIKEADVVIWACGYITNHIPFYDTKNNLVEFLHDEAGSTEVDKQLQLMNKNKTSIKNLFGIGQGYATKTPEIINGKSARADSINIYNTYVSAKLYKSLESILGKASIENMTNIPANISAMITKKLNENPLAEPKVVNPNTHNNLNQFKKNIALEKVAHNGHKGDHAKEEEKKKISVEAKSTKNQTKNTSGHANINLNQNCSPRGLVNNIQTKIATASPNDKDKPQSKSNSENEIHIKSSKNVDAHK